MTGHLTDELRERLTAIAEAAPPLPDDTLEALRDLLAPCVTCAA